MGKKEEINKNKIKELLSELNRSEEIKQIAAIKELRIHGNETIIRSLVEVLIAINSTKIKAEITDLFNTIKSTKVPKEIALCLSNNTFKEAHQILLASVWNSGLDYNKYLKEIITATVKGGFMEAIECITIIENVESDFDEEQIMEALIIMKEYLVENKGDTSPKMEILKEIIVLLEQINDQL